MKSVWFRASRRGINLRSIRQTAAMNATNIRRMKTGLLMAVSYLTCCTLLDAQAYPYENMVSEQESGSGISKKERSHSAPSRFCALPFRAGLGIHRSHRLTDALTDAVCPIPIRYGPRLFAKVRRSGLRDYAVSA